MSKEVKVEEVLIHSYSRKEAIEDGFLLDVSSMGYKLGFRYPIAVTRAVWERYIVGPDEVGRREQDARLRDMLWMLKAKIKAVPQHARHFEVFVLDENEQLKLASLKAVCGPGDDGEPVLTIMLPSED